ncbi:MAG TPA: EAL domain-containing protein [Arenimonas sp.]|nr:EAL domain-containing protein [Arenimonas sp.]
MLPLLPNRYRRAIEFSLLVALYVAAGAFSILMAVGPDDIVLFWPASGIALAGVVRFGLRWIWFVPLATLLLHLGPAPVPLAFLPWSLAANTLGVLIGGWVVLRRVSMAPVSVRFAFRILFGGLALSLASALIGCTGLLVAGMIDHPGEPFVRWLLGNLLGVAASVPAMLLWLAPRHTLGPELPPNTYAPEGERLLWNIALTASYVLLGWGSSHGAHYSLGLSALPLAVLVWSAIRFPLLHTAVATLITLLLIAAFAGLGLAGYPVPERMTDTINLLAFLSLLAVIPMLLAFSVHQHRVASERLRLRASTDPLTGLANRDAFEERVRAEIDDPAAPPMALAYLDLDNLKLVNDTASHAAGDALIRALGGVIESCRNRGDLVARTGGDEFAVLLRNCTPMVAEDRIRTLLRAIEGYRFSWEGQVLSTTASAGVVAFLPGQGEYAQLLSQADAACFTAKELGGNRVCLAGLHASDLHDRTTAMRWAVRLREALEQGSLDLYCQSIVPLNEAADTGRHFEILLRLRDPRGGERLMPEQFVPAAERFHLGPRIDREVLSRTLAWFEAHPKAAASVAMCGINLSGEALVDEGFIAFVAERLRHSSFPASRLCFEVTETSAVRDLARAQRFIAEMRRLGCRFAIDDFGTGFCSFSYLRSLDVDYFKIDGSFVREMDSSPLAEAVVRSITDIAHVLDKRSIAEHTESEAQRQALKALGVDYAQGYCIDKPMAIAEYFRAELDRPHQ